MKWIEFASNFPVDSGTSLKALSELNEDLSKKSVILGNGLKISEADIVVFAAVHSSVVYISFSLGAFGLRKIFSVGNILIYLFLSAWLGMKVGDIW